MAATQTTYIDANGEKKTGYIIDGTTYTDAEGKNAVGIGSIVNTSAGQYIKTANGSMLYSDYLKNNDIHQVDTELNGVGGTGYIKDGATYTDALLKNRVGTGTVVTAVDGTKYIKTDDGSMLYSDYLKQQEEAESQANLKRQEEEIDKAYNKALASNDSATAAQLQLQRARIQEQIEQLNQSYSDLNRQLYRDYMFNQRDLPQQLAAQGITGGMAESSKIGLATDYESGLSANERGRLSDITSLERGGNEAELQMRIEKIRADAEAEDKRYDRLATLLAAQQQQDNFERQLAISEDQRAIDNAHYDSQWENTLTQQELENSWKERQWTYETGAEAQERARSEIDAYLAAGGSAKDLPKELLTAAGYSSEYVSTMATYYADEKEKSEDDAAYERELAEAKLAAQYGDTTRLFELLGIMAPAATTSPSPSPAPSPSPSPNPSPSPTPTPTRDLSNYVKSVNGILGSQGAEQADTYLQACIEYGYLTAEEAQYIENQVLAAYGL